MTSVDSGMGGFPHFNPDDDRDGMVVDPTCLRPALHRDALGDDGSIAGEEARGRIRDAMQTLAAAAGRCADPG